MSSFNRRIACLMLAALVAGCGFSPVYAPGGAGNALQGAVQARDPSSRTEFLYLDALESRLGQATAPAYTLEYSIATSSDALGVTVNDVTTRYQLIGSARITLKRIDTDEVILTDTVKGFTGYSATGTALSLESAGVDASARLMTILADRTVTRLLALDL